MKKRIWSGACAATLFGLAVGVTAAQSSSQSPQSSAAKSIIVTGCIQRTQQSPTGTSGTAASTRASETKFLLTNAAMSKAGTTGTAGSTPPPSTAVSSEYRLDADDAKLAPHVGHKVEITGILDQPPSTTQAPAASAANSPMLKVENVKMIASTCP